MRAVPALADDPTAAATRELALELHRLLAELDRSRFRWREMVAGLRERLAGVRARLDLLVERGPSDATLRERLVALRKAMEAYAPTSDVRAEWLAFRTRVVMPYEELATSLRASSIHVPSLRPKNYVRNAYHIANAAFSLALLELAPSWTWIIAIAWGAALAGWTMEISRRVSPTVNALCMRLFASVAHPHEAHRINSATFYVTAVAVLATTRELVPCALALTTLGLGDPIAAIVGRRWGRVRWVNGRSVEGTLAFVIAATIGGVALLTLVHGVAWPAALALAGAASLLGAFAELYSRKVDDNLSIPVMAWVGAYLVGLAVS